MSDSSMVERVAAAIWQSPTFDDIAARSAGGPRPSAWQDAHALDQAPIRILARAALDAPDRGGFAALADGLQSFGG